MSGRFEKLYALQNDLYSDGAPIIVSAGALLKDTETGRIIVQMKYHSLSATPIIALKVGISAYDIEGKQLEGIGEYQYLDLNISIGQDFGANKAIVMPNATTRSFEISNITAIMSNGATKDVALPMQPLPKSDLLFSVLKNKEAVRQYQIETTSNATYIPQDYNNLWYCTCGEWNILGNCTKCQNTKNKVFGFLNTSLLEPKISSRLVAEKAENEKAKKDEHKKKRQKIAIISAVIIAIICIISGTIYSSQHKYDDIAGVYVLANESEAEKSLYKVHKDSIDEFGFNPQSFDFEIKGSGKIYGLWFVNKRGTLTPRAATVENLSNDGTCTIALKDYPDATVVITINLKNGQAVYYSEYGYHSLTLSYKRVGVESFVDEEKSENQKSTADKIVGVRGLTAYVPSEWKVYNQASENLGRASIGSDNEYRSWYISYEGKYDTFSSFVKGNPDEVYEADDPSSYREYDVDNCKEGHLCVVSTDGELVVDFYVVCKGHVFNLTYTSRTGNDHESKTEAEQLLKDVDFKNFVFE